MKENFVIYTEDYVLIKNILLSLKNNTNAKLVFISDVEGHCISSSGEIDDYNLNSISSLIAGSVAAVNSIAQMLKIEGFHTVLNESKSESLYIAEINDYVMLAVIFDSSTNLGLVRFRVKDALEKLAKVFVEIERKISSGEKSSELSPFDGVTDEDIDRIFGD